MAKSKSDPKPKTEVVDDTPPDPEPEEEESEPAPTEDDERPPGDEHKAPGGHEGQPGREHRVTPGGQENYVRPQGAVQEAVGDALRERADNPKDAKPDDTPVRVRALKMGYVDHVRRRTGDVFDVPTSGFTPTWMEVVDGDTPTKVTTAKASLKAIHDDALAGKMPPARSSGSGRSSGDRDVTS